MPITVTAPIGVFTPAGEREILPRLTAAMLRANEAEGNPFFSSITGGTLHLLAPDLIFAGGVNRPVVMVEVKLPDIGLDTTEARARFIAEATDLVHELTRPGHHREDIWVNILNAPAGGWGVGGRAYTGEALEAAAQASVSTVFRN
jgi:phenylpyruvate tautomerase PptA (4-oxalocrotonate tautomerase family)